MLNKKQIEMLMGLLEGHLEDAETELEAALEENDGVNEAQEALDELTEISMTLEVMKGMTEEADDIESLRAENATLRKVLGEISVFAEKIAGIGKAPHQLGGRQGLEK